MPAELFIVPVASAAFSKNFSLTVAAGGDCHYWGLRATPGNVRKWNLASVGDYVVFKDAYRFIASARIEAKVHDRELARSLWGIDGKGYVWEYIWKLSPPKTLNLPVSDYHAFFGVREGGPDRVSAERLSNAFSVLGKEHLLRFFAVDEEWISRFSV